MNPTNYISTESHKVVFIAVLTKIGFQNVLLSRYRRESLLSNTGIHFSEAPSTLVWAFERSSSENSRASCVPHQGHVPPVRRRWLDTARTQPTVEGVFTSTLFNLDCVSDLPVFLHSSFFTAYYQRKFSKPSVFPIISYTFKCFRWEGC